MFSTAQAATAFLMMTVPVAGLTGAEQASFRSDALAVRVDVLVAEGRRPVSGLTPADFELRDNGVLQTVEVVDTSAVPVNVVLAFDISASTSGARHHDLVSASRALLEALTPIDRAALTTFSHAILPRVALTHDLARVREGIEQSEPAGRTAVFDGAYAALAAAGAEPGRSVVILCTDGTDVSSWLEPAELVEAARRSSAVVYAVAASGDVDEEALERLAEATGGDVIRVQSTRDLRRVFEDIIRDFRSRYVLSYAPTQVETGGLHRLEVKVKRRGLTVRARSSYIGLSPPR